MNRIEVARNTPGVMKHLKANLVRKPFTCEALKACLWPLSSFKVFPGGTKRPPGTIPITPWSEPDRSCPLYLGPGETTTRSQEPLVLRELT